MCECRARNRGLHNGASNASNARSLAMSVASSDVTVRPQSAHSRFRHSIELLRDLPPLFSSQRRYEATLICGEQS
jgi:hypothetical protein